MSASHSASTTSTQHAGQGVHAGASAAAAPSNTVLVAGQSGESVNVQSQLATSHVAGDVSSKSNISQVIGDLGAHHSTSGAWLDAETAKVSQWGQKEIERVLQQTKAMEEALVLGAKEKQKALDASHSGEIAKLVQELDLRKAAELKELEDGLQRTIQATLSSSKADINRVETEMNNRKMELLKQSQLKSAKEIDALSNLVVETKLVPSQTRTVIETNTETGHVLAVATGGSIATGSAQAESYSSQKIAAVPNAGELKQAADVTVGDMIQDSTGRKVGEGAIVNTQTRVQEQHGQQPLVAGQHHSAAVVAPAAHTSTTVAHPTTGAAVPLPAHAAAHHSTTGVTAAVAHPSTSAHTDAHHATTGAHHNTHNTHNTTTAHPAKTAVVTGVPIASGGHADAAVSHKQDLRTEIADGQAHAVHQKDSIMAHGHHAGSSHDGDSTGAEPHQHGLLCKVKHALGMKTKGDETAAAEQHAAATDKHNVAYPKSTTVVADKSHTAVATEPRSTDATRRAL